MLCVLYLWCEYLRCCDVVNLLCCVVLCCGVVCFLVHALRGTSVFRGTRQFLGNITLKENMVMKEMIDSMKWIFEPFRKFRTSLKISNDTIKNTKMLRYMNQNIFRELCHTFQYSYASCVVLCALIVDLLDWHWFSSLLFAFVEFSSVRFNSPQPQPQLRPQPQTLLTPFRFTPPRRSFWGWFITLFLATYPMGAFASLLGSKDGQSTKNRIKRDSTPPDWVERRWEGKNQPNTRIHPSSSHIAYCIGIRMLVRVAPSAILQLRVWSASTMARIDYYSISLSWVRRRIFTQPSLYICSVIQFSFAFSSEWCLHRFRESVESTIHSAPPAPFRSGKFTNQRGQ